MQQIQRYQHTLYASATLTHVKLKLVPLLESLRGRRLTKSRRYPQNAVFVPAVQCRNETRAQFCSQGARISDRHTGIPTPRRMAPLVTVVTLSSSYGDPRVWSRF
jgi:hypothetical protein